MLSLEGPATTTKTTDSEGKTRCSGTAALKHTQVYPQGFGQAHAAAFKEYFLKMYTSGLDAPAGAGSTPAGSTSTPAGSAWAPAGSTASSDSTTPSASGSGSTASADAMAAKRRRIGSRMDELKFIIAALPAEVLHDLRDAWWLRDFEPQGAPWESGLANELAVERPLT